MNDKDLGLSSPPPPFDNNDNGIGLPPPPFDSPPQSIIKKQSSPKLSPVRPSSPPNSRQQSDPPLPTAAPLPPKPAAKSRRKSLLDIKADKKAVIAAATENLKNLNQKVDIDAERESEEFGDTDLIRDSIQTFSKPFSKTNTILENDENENNDDDDDNVPVHIYVPPRRASIRLSDPPINNNNSAEEAWKRRSSEIRRQSISQGATPLTALELKRGTRLSNFQPFTGIL